MQPSNNIINLFNRYLNNQASAEEISLLLKHFDAGENENLLRTKIRQQLEAPVDMDASWQKRLNNAYNNILGRISHTSEPRRIQILRTHWVRYAAAIILIAGAATFLWLKNQNSSQNQTSINHNLYADILPGTHKAILTLADGSTIELDSATNGELAQQGNVAIVKLNNGEIAYHLKGVGEGGLINPDDQMMNTMSTPNGGQYQLTLPDGSKVWLNAASSITYPAVFVGKQRNVKIKGEAYFEVAKDKEAPFIVDIDGKSTVEVLGTSFNINSYENEAYIKATLVEGSVKITKENQSAFLKPGQQARIDNAITVKSDVDITQALAWKNGLFNFNGSDLRSVMRQLERWYDIKVQYEGSISNDVFKGEMYRNVNLSTVLRALQKMGVNYKLDGKTVVVH